MSLKAKPEKSGSRINNVLIVAGGTGGHIFPALAFGRWLLAREKAERVLYLSGNRPLEIEIYRSQGVEPHRLPLEGSPLGGGSILRNLGRWGGLIRSFFYVKKFLRHERPDGCFLFGSYVSLMPLLLCKILGIPAIVHEQNASAGKVTRLASYLGVPVVSGWNECHGVKIFTPVGVPIRPLEKISRQTAAAALGVSVNNKDIVIGIVGGSLSSASLSELAGKMGRVPTTHAPGDSSHVFVVLGEAPSNGEPGVCFVGRRWDMTAFYSLCDAVICRAGASTLAELAAYGIPALTLPWEGAADGHQEANARCFVALTGNSSWSAEEGNDALDEKFLDLLLRASGMKYTDGSKSEPDDACSALWQFWEKNFLKIVD